MTTTAQNVEMWFDPICPFAWITSRWLLEASQVRDIEVTWNIMSLAHLNKDREMDADHTESFKRSWGAVRLVAAVKEKNGNEGVVALYTALGNRIHLNKEKVSDELLIAALADAGLPAELIADAADESWNEKVIASHDRAIAMVGNDVGTPVLAIGDAAFFGPVISPAPKGEAAGKLWDGFVLCLQTPEFFELKRARKRGPNFA
jgi:predicted DsbA family dithiol-disulfide isomerase